MALRWILLAIMSWALLAVLAPASGDAQASTSRLLVVSVIALLAPIFWPGVSADRRHTIWRVAGWSVMAAALALPGIVLAGGAARAWAAVAMSCAMLLALLLVAHTAAAVLESRLRASSTDAGARAAAGRIVTLALTAAGALPLWLGPAAEVLSQRHESLIDGVVGLSPLTHLAVASGNDLLRNQWMYQHSNLATLAFQYPDAATLAGAYVAAVALLAVSAWALWPGRPSSPTAHQPDPQEKLR
jgi:hypothetical protein